MNSTSTSHARVIAEALDQNATNLENLKMQTATIARSADVIIEALKAGCTIYFCGNGGSAADAQHLAAELSGKFLKSRRPLPGIALTTNSSTLTAIGNDFGFDEIFSRQLEGVGKRGDVLVSLSTSGNSPNIVKVVEIARSCGIKTIGLTGERTSALSEKCDICLKMPSVSTPRIQEMHILVGHILCELAENAVT